MRFIAAAMVFCFHTMFQNMFAAPGAKAKMSTLFFQGGWSGVGFFFVLSGFVLTWSARPTDTAAKFWRRRFFKIYPNHLLTFCAAVILLSWVSHAAINGRDVLANLFLIHAYFPQLHTISSVNNVAWSLSCEALFYFCFPFLIALIGRIRPARLWIWAGVVVAIIMVVPTVASTLPGRPMMPGAPIGQWQFWFIYIFPPVRMLDFVFGIILARIVRTHQKLPLGLGGAVAFAITAYLLAPLFPTTFTFVALMVVPLGLVIAAGAAADVAGRPTWLSSRGMVWLGDVSFAIYMTHWLVLTYGHHWLGDGKQWSTPVATALVAMLFGVTLLLSWLLFSLVERPIMWRFAASRRTRRPVAAPLPGPPLPGPPLSGPPLSGPLVEPKI